MDCKYELKPDLHDVQCTMHLIKFTYCPSKKKSNDKHDSDCRIFAPVVELNVQMSIIARNKLFLTPKYNIEITMGSQETKLSPESCGRPCPICCNSPFRQR
ncbi:hypothetical protein E2986_14107 [Frieseomelitta varia]|uniref:Uncharacterized protein n=1 Tax=Frieseomelitta varia TaxID=561572 RepID=A0A833W9J2_9HYME|nr:hypothetical protein E2986_14107 [Frieseomelitta varia]